MAPYQDIAGSRNQNSELAPPDLFSPQEFPLITDIKYQAPFTKGLPDAPVFTFCLALTGIALLGTGLVASLAHGPVPTAGAVLLVGTLPSYIIEKIINYRAIAIRMATQRPAVEQIRVLRQRLSGYLASLDQRTSRYFHCVTNSKVTNYFMLRQIENSLSEQIVEFDRLLKYCTQANFFRAQEKLRGTLEYRDGFAFNSGRVLFCPMHLLPARVQELVFDLERGISALESEISVYRDQVHGTTPSVPDKQVPLPLSGTSESDGEE